MIEGQPPLPHERPPLVDYRAEPQDPSSLAPNWGSLAQLFADVRHPQLGHPDGFLVMNAPARNGLTPVQIGAAWAAARTGLSSAEVPAAARAHFDKHFDITAAGVQVPTGEEGESVGDYARRILYEHLRRPAREADTDTRLRTKYPFFVPGSRFSDPFPVDNVLVGLALLGDNRVDESLQVIGNIEHDTMRLGYAPNFGKASIYRTQTPLDSLLLEAQSSIYGDEALRHFHPALVRNLDFLRSGIETLGDIPPNGFAAHRRIVRLHKGEKTYTGVRSWEDAPMNFKRRIGPRMESEVEDVELGEQLISSFTDEGEQEYHWIRLMRSLGAACESWQDMADWQLADRKNLITSRTIDILTPWVQAAVAHKTKLAAQGSEALGNYHEAEKYWQQFNGFSELINDLMWRDIDETHGHYTDILLDGTQTGALNAAQILPLLVGGIVPYDRAIKTVNTWRDSLLGDYGLHTSDILDCPEQWSGIRDWPSLAILAIHSSMQAAVDAKASGLDSQPFVDFAQALTEALHAGITAWYEKHRTLPERIHGTNPTEVAIGGEYCKTQNGQEPEPQIGFGMTAASLLLAEIMQPAKMEFDPQLGPWLRQAFAQEVGRLLVPVPV